MTLEYSEGCVNDSLNINNIETIDIDKNDFKQIIHKLIDKIDDISELQDILKNFIQMNGDEVASGYCEQCGDYWSTYQYKFNDEEFEKFFYDKYLNFLNK